MVFLFSNHLAVLSKTDPLLGKLDTLYVLCVSESSRQDSMTPTPGEYFLEVKNIDKDKRPNEAKEPPIRVIVISQFWNTWWFKSLCLLAAGAIFFSLYQVRVKFIALKGNQQRKMNRFFSKYNLSSREQEIALFLPRNSPGSLYLSMGRVPLIKKRTTLCGVRGRASQGGKPTGPLKINSSSLRTRSKITSITYTANWG